MQGVGWLDSRFNNNVNQLGMKMDSMQSQFNQTLNNFQSASGDLKEAG